MLAKDAGYDSGGSTDCRSAAEADATKTVKKPTILAAKRSAGMPGWVVFAWSSLPSFPLPAAWRDATPWITLTFSLAASWLIGAYYAHIYGHVRSLPGMHARRTALKWSVVYPAMALALIVDGLMKPPIMVSGLVFAAGAVLTALAACESADFLYLQRLTGLSKGNLSSHLTKLEGAGFVQIDKHFVGKTPRTNARLTAEGRMAITQYWQQVDMLREASLRLAPDT